MKRIEEGMVLCSKCGKTIRQSFFEDQEDLLEEYCNACSINEEAHD